MASAGSRRSGRRDVADAVTFSPPPCYSKPLHADCAPWEHLGVSRRARHVAPQTMRSCGAPPPPVPRRKHLAAGRSRGWSRTQRHRQRARACTRHRQGSWPSKKSRQTVGQGGRPAASSVLGLRGAAPVAAALGWCLQLEAGIRVGGGGEPALGGHRRSAPLSAAGRLCAGPQGPRGGTSARGTACGHPGGCAVRKGGGQPARRAGGAQNCVGSLLAGPVPSAMPAV
jgi:hypothetical protein